MRHKVNKIASVREKNIIVIDILTAKPLWKDNLNYLIIESFLKYAFIPETIYCNSLGFIGNKKGVTFCREKLDQVFTSYCSPKKSTINDIYLNELVFFFAKKPVKFNFSIRFNGGRANYGHNSVSFTLEMRDFDLLQRNVMNVFTELCLQLTPDFARLQFYTAKENYNNKRSIGTDIILPDLLSGLSDIYAITVFGKPYINFFGQELILSTPCFKVKVVTNDLILLQLSDYVFDERGSKETLLYIGQTVKAHLNNNAFYDGLSPWEHQYNVPQFDLSEIRKPLYNLT